jgi:hypothetical protein
MSTKADNYSNNYINNYISKCLPIILKFYYSKNANSNYN